jgi:threonine/homoserine/homoserine lactone efflux protein
MGVLVIRRTLAHGARAGLFTGLGIASADAIYATIAAFGLSFLSNLLLDAQTAIRLVGGLFLLYLGIRTFLARPATEAASTTGVSLASSYGSALALTLANPQTILMFAGIFAGVGLSTAADPRDAALLVAGVFSGSILWWLVLSSGVSLLRGRFTPGVMVWVNRLSGFIIIAFGLVALAGLWA